MKVAPPQLWRCAFRGLKVPSYGMYEGAQVVIPKTSKISLGVTHRFIEVVFSISYTFSKQRKSSVRAQTQ